MEYQDFLEGKRFESKSCGFEIDESKLNSKLFDFQKAIVKWALKKGRAAIFADCGMGKTPMQLEWATRVCYETGGDVLIVAPLAVSEQTVREGVKFDMLPVTLCRSQDDVKPGLNITNYEMLNHFHPELFAGIVLDESSILKSYTGKIRNDIISMFHGTQYKLACTATPAPNDFSELGNHSEFLNVYTRPEMLSMFFVNDTGDVGTWRLKGHCEDKFWEWVATWGVLITKPSDIGFDDTDFILPPLNIENIVVESPESFADGDMFLKLAETLTERRDARRESLELRVGEAATLANGNDDQWLIWCDLNVEGDMLKKCIADSVEVKGADKNEHKVDSMIGFQDNKIRCLVTKSKIAGHGMNFQSCHNIVFVGLSDSYESFYQAIRRCWRFGQRKEVNVYIITSAREGNVVDNIKRKEHNTTKMIAGIVDIIKDKMNEQLHGEKSNEFIYKKETTEGDTWKLMLGDTTELIKDIESDSIHYSLFSPPFASLFTYTNSERDLGNCKNVPEFMEHFKFIVKELYRIMMPGRMLSFHCMNMPATITHDGYIGMIDFRGDLIRLFQEVGFVYYSEVCIWKDPLVQATRTKTLTLAHKQIAKDSARCAQGYPDYVVGMFKPGVSAEPVSKGRGFEYYVGGDDEPTHAKNDNPRLNKYSHNVWQRYASPVWHDIRQTKTLNLSGAREEKDEKHMCPLQLDTIARCYHLWSNSGDTVFTPFAGIGSEIYQAIKMGRKAIGIELKESYYKAAIKNIKMAENELKQGSLFGTLEETQ